jgi:hypothetical protein
VRPVGDRQLQQMGKDGPDTAPAIKYETQTVGARGPTPRTVRVPEGIDPGWAYTPGRSWTRSFTPPQIDDLLPSATPALAATTKPALPAPRIVSADRVLPGTLKAQAYVDRFLAEFGIAAPDRSSIFEDVTGQYLVMSDDLFRGYDGVLKPMKRGRAPYVLLYADTIKLPDEIWEDFAEFGGQQILRRRYIARFQVEGNTIPAVAVFETGPQGWVGVTAHKPDDIKDLENRSRQGTPVYRREE